MSVYRFFRAEIYQPFRRSFFDRQRGRCRKMPICACSGKHEYLAQGLVYQRDLPCRMACQQKTLLENWPEEGGIILGVSHRQEPDGKNENPFCTYTAVLGTYQYTKTEQLHTFLSSMKYWEQTSQFPSSLSPKGSYSRSLERKHIVGDNEFNHPSHSQVYNHRKQGVSPNTQVCLSKSHHRVYIIRSMSLSRWNWHVIISGISDTVVYVVGTAAIIAIPLLSNR